MSARRVIAGFLVAPALPALVVLALQSASIAQGRAEWGTSLFAVLSYATAIVVGLPSFLLLKRHLAASFTMYAVLGAAIGAVPACLLFVPDIAMGWESQHEHARLLLGNLWRVLLGGAVLGSLSASVFWVIAIRPR
jgi:hypothetical protein